ncbi:MAG: hypothetical protein NTNFB01_32130 [Nitrospira sp.]
MSFLCLCQEFTNPLAPYGRRHTPVRLPCPGGQRNPESLAFADPGKVFWKFDCRRHMQRRLSLRPHSAHTAPDVSEMHAIRPSFFGDLP